MKFTLVFATHEKVDLSYGVLFNPSPVFVRGSEVLLAPTPDRREYTRGSMSKLLEREQILRSLVEAQRQCTVIIHPIGKGTIQDLQNLVNDLRQEGFSVTVVGFNGFEPYDFTVSF